MEVRCYIYESGYPVSVDYDLYPYEVISIIDELEKVLNPKGVWDAEKLVFIPPEVKEYYYITPKKHADYLVIACENRETRGPKDFPESFLKQWVTHTHIEIHPENYGLSPRSRKWSKVTVLFSFGSDDNILRTTSKEAEEENL
jgi:hypothetical protein